LNIVVASSELKSEINDKSRTLLVIWLAASVRHHRPPLQFSVKAGERSVAIPLARAQANHSDTLPGMSHRSMKIEDSLGARPLSYKQRPGRFGNNRSGGRLHAGCDLYAPVGTPVLAVADGVALLYNPYFYQGTGEPQIGHTHFIARYCEISSVPEGIKGGVTVKEGQVVAYVGICGVAT
jgi:murein DD-endopeptidase MepM/ murein hydrolase activator NlpD